MEGQPVCSHFEFRADGWHTGILVSALRSYAGKHAAKCGSYTCHPRHAAEKAESHVLEIQKLTERLLLG